jgi:hypothetical protein
LDYNTPFTSEVRYGIFHGTVRCTQQASDLGAFGISDFCFMDAQSVSIYHLLTGHLLYMLGAVTDTKDMGHTKILAQKELAL